MSEVRAPSHARPRPGYLVRPSRFQEITRPDFDGCIAYWDLKLSDSMDGSWVVGQVWGRAKGDVFLLDPPSTSASHDPRPVGQPP